MARLISGFRSLDEDRKGRRIRAVRARKQADRRFKSGTAPRVAKTGGSRMTQDIKLYPPKQADRKFKSGTAPRVAKQSDRKFNRDIKLYAPKQADRKFTQATAPKIATSNKRIVSRPLKAKAAMHKARKSKMIRGYRGPGHGK